MELEEFVEGYKGHARLEGKTKNDLTEVYDDFTEKISPEDLTKEMAEVLYKTYDKGLLTGERRGAHDVRREVHARSPIFGPTILP